MKTELNNFLILPLLRTYFTLYNYSFCFRQKLEKNLDLGDQYSERQRKTQFLRRNECDHGIMQSSRSRLDRNRTDVVSKQLQIRQYS